jgi:hypothetical protein
MTGFDKWLRYPNPDGMQWSDTVSLLYYTWALISVEKLSQFNSNLNYLLYPELSGRVSFSNSNWLPLAFAPGFKGQSWPSASSLAVTTPYFRYQIIHMPRRGGGSVGGLHRRGEGGINTGDISLPDSPFTRDTELGFSGKLILKWRDNKKPLRAYPAIQQCFKTVDILWIIIEVYATSNPKWLYQTSGNSHTKTQYLFIRV